MASDRPNFFDLLELDPDMPWEPQGKAAYERQLSAKKAEWAKRQNAPGKAGADAKRYSDMAKKNEIQSVMEDAAKRAAEAEDCRRRRKDRRNQLQKLLEDWKQHANSITKQQISVWSRAVEMTPADVEKAAVQAGLKTPKEAPSGGPPKPQINQVTLGNVRDKLNTLRKIKPAESASFETLYTFLQLTPSANVEALIKAASDINADLQKNMNKTELFFTTQIELTGLAKDVFKSIESKALYDEALRLQPLIDLLDEMEVQTGGVKPRAPHIKVYEEGALRAGFSQNEARTELLERAKVRKWDDIEDSDTYKLCPFCDKLIPLNVNACPECAKLLTLTCPNCNQAGIDVKVMACPACGFQTGMREVVEDVINDALDALEKHDYATARRHATEARRIWSPAYPDDLVARMDSLDERLTRHDQDLKVQQAQELLNKAESAAAGGDHATAQKLIEQVNALGVASQGDIAKRITAVMVQRGQSLLNEAQRATLAGEYAKAQGFIDQVQTLGVAGQEEIAKRITELHILQGQQLLNEAEGAIRTADYVTARDTLDEVKALTEVSQPSLAQRVKELEDKLAPHEKEIQDKKEEEREEERNRQEAEREKERQRQEQLKEQIKSIEGSITSKNLEAAKKRVGSLPAETQKQANVVALLQKIDGGIRAADERVRLANKATSEEEIVELCLEALNICADHSDAEKLLKASRPRTVEDVTAVANASQDTVTISWKASGEKRVTYYVVRKAEAKPTAVSDGDIIAQEITDRMYVDNHPLIGVGLYYAVFAKRARVDRFSLPAFAPDPVVLATDVTEARAEAGDRSIALTWRAPERAAVIVRRRRGVPPTSALDGDSVPLNSANSAFDKNLTNGTVYYYRIYCSFAGRATSAGVLISATPHVRPAAPPPLKISSQLNYVDWCDVDLQWGDDSRASRGGESVPGRKVVYRTDNAAPFKQGATFSASEVAPHVWREFPIENGRASDQLARPDVVTYVPAIIVQDRVYSGAPKEFRFIPALEQVEAQSAVGAIHVTWKWPPHIQEAVIAWGTSLPENPLQAQAATVVVRKKIIERGEERDEERGEHDVTAPAGKRISLVIASIIRMDGRVVADTSQTLEGKAAEMGAIEYEFARPSGGFFKKKIPNHSLRLRVRNAGPLRGIPPLLVRFKEGQVPANEKDGEEWTVLETQPLPSGEVILPLPGLTRRRSSALYGGVFFADTAHAREAQLSSAGEDKTRL